MRPSSEGWRCFSKSGMHDRDYNEIFTWRDNLEFLRLKGNRVTMEASIVHCVDNIQHLGEAFPGMVNHYKTWPDLSFYLLWRT